MSHGVLVDVLGIVLGAVGVFMVAAADPGVERVETPDERWWLRIWPSRDEEVSQTWQQVGMMLTILGAGILVARVLLIGP
jgi:hypothetical protein